MCIYNSIMFRILLVLAALLPAVVGPISAAVEIPLGGNAYVTRHSEGHGPRISDRGVSDWSADEVVSTYFYVDTAGRLELSLRIVPDGAANLSVAVAGAKFDVAVPGQEGEHTVAVGAVEVSAPGYVRVDMEGRERAGDTYGRPVALVLGGDAAAKAEYVHDGFSFHFGRRGPSVHLNYPLPEDEDIEWFYNELTVGEGDDVVGSYFMANGFGEGYFGMQVNSPQERRILFSIWSPYETDRPHEIPDSMKIRLVRKGEGVYTGQFGGEGSGGQSRIGYMWRAGITYGFLTRIRPTGRNTTLYTSYFYAPEKGVWMLIAEFERPMTDTYYKRAHSFLENFSPSMGWIQRKGCYGNQWARTADGRWIEITRARFSADETARRRQRLDYTGGVTPTGDFFMQNGGFFSGGAAVGSWFVRPPKGRVPQIDFDSLP